MPKRLRDKLGVKTGMRCILVHAPENAASMLGLSSAELEGRLTGLFDYVHFFTTQQSELQKVLPNLERHLRPSGMLWVSWPKAKQRSTDLTLKDVIRLAYDGGLVESKTISVDATWSAIKLTRPKEGKKYKNSYGRLP